MIDFDFLSFFKKLHHTGGAVGRYEMYGRLSFLVNAPSLIKAVLENKENQYNLAPHPYHFLEDAYTPEGKFILQFSHNKKAEDLLVNIVAQAKETMALFQGKLKEGTVDFSVLSKQLFFTMVTKNLFNLDLIANSFDFVTAASLIEEWMANTESFDPTSLPEEYRQEFMEARAKVNILTELIRTRLQIPEKEGGNNAIFKTLMNGYNGIAVSLAWMLYHLSMDQRLEQELYEEIKALPALANLKYQEVVEKKYLHAFVMEGLRYYPPSWVLGRTAQKDHQLGPFFIPKNANVSICLYTLHRDPKYWEHPNEFDPHRFLKPRSFIPYTYLPFGKGPGKCPAQSLAFLHLKIALIAILRDFKIKPSNQKYQPWGLISLSPEEAICLELERRK